MNRKLKFDFAGFQTSLSKRLISDLMVLLIGKHLIRAVLTFSTNLTLCDSSFSAFHYPIVSQFRWSPVSNTSDRIGTDQWNCETRWIFPRLAIGTLSLIFLYFLSSSSPVCVISSLFHRYKLSFILSYFLSLFDNVLILYCKNIPSILSTVPIFFFFLRSFIRHLNFLLPFSDYPNFYLYAFRRYLPVLRCRNLLNLPWIFLPFHLCSAI